MNTTDTTTKGTPRTEPASPPRYFWEQNYQIGDSFHWALNDTHSTQEGMVSSAYMILLADYATCMDGKPLSEQFMPKKIVDLLNGESETAALRQRVSELEGALKQEAGLAEEEAADCPDWHIADRASKKAARLRAMLTKEDSK